MIIAINTRLRKEDQPAGYENFLFELLDHLTKKNPQHQFIFIFDRPFDDGRNFRTNVLPIAAGPETKTRLRLQYWFNYKIPAILRKYKAEVFVSLEGICSMRTKKPQCLVITDPGFLLNPSSGKKSNNSFYKKHTAGFLSRAKSIATVSEHDRSVIADQYKINETDIDLIRPGVDNVFKPVEWEEKEIIKDKYTEGKSYFLFSGDIDHRSNLINLLKAFSFFKKRQKSNMLLLIAGKADESFKKELKTYKYRNEVLLMEGLTKEELVKITAAAYSFVYPVLHDSLGLTILQAMRSAVPVITSNTAALVSLCGDAALYADPASVNDIAENMMLVFKNEDKARELVQAGNALQEQHRWDKAADQLMQFIEKSVNS